MKQLHFLIILFILLSLSNCQIIKTQNSYLSGIRKASSNRLIVLSSDQKFKQTRGALNDTYFAVAGAGAYRLIFESDSGEFYFAEEPKFICEYYRVGGIFLNKNDSTFILWTSGFLKKEKAIKKFSSERFVKRLDRYNSGREPFVHWYYRIDRSNLSFTGNTN